LFDFYSKVIKAPQQKIDIAESLRNRLSRDNRVIKVNDLGSGSGKANQRTISSVAAKSLSSAKFSSLYYRIISRYGHTSIVELGTSLGINTLYLANEPKTVVTTFEGCNEIADLAEFTFQFAQAGNIKVIRGNIDQTLPSFLQTVRKIDFVFIDANHTYEATIKYFNLFLSRIHEKSMVVVDDIHFSSSMNKAWNEIRGNKLVYGSIDLHRAGILFFDPSLNKQNVILQF
jgi:predicted O-methyltransferase YrrM